MVATVAAMAPDGAGSPLVPVGRVSAALAVLQEAAAAVSQACAFSADHRDLVQSVTALPQVDAVVDSALSAVLDAARLRGVAQQEGFRRIDQMVLARSNASGASVRTMARRGEWLRDFNEFSDAHGAGTLTVDHVEKIRRGLDSPRTHFLLRRDQSMIVEAAQTCDFRDFERFCDYWKLAADPDGAEPRDQLARTRFSARRQADGMVKLSGLLDPLSGQTFLSAWERQVQQLALAEEQDPSVAPVAVGPVADAAPDGCGGAVAPGDGCGDAVGTAHTVRSVGDPRRHGRRGAQALLQLVAKGSARADGSHPEPLVHVVMSLRVAQDTLRRLAQPDPAPLPVNHHSVDGRCELIDGTPIHPFLVATVLGVAALQRTVMDARGRPLSTSHPTRAFPKWLRHLTLLRSRGRCESDGCDAPFPWLQLDHRHPWSLGGPTSYQNGQALCRPHNLAKGVRSVSPP